MEKNDFSTIINIPGWFKERGKEDDVVVSSRVRLSRNLSEYMFPPKLLYEEEQKIQNKVKEAFAAIPETQNYLFNYIDDLSNTEKRMLLERDIISKEYSLHGHKILGLDENQQIAVLVNEIDHLRFIAYNAGLNLTSGHEAIDELETHLEKHLNFAASLDWGYLNTIVKNCGTGLKISVMLHLPALEKTTLLDGVVKSIVQLGFSVKGYIDDDNGSLGQLYQVSNEVAIGYNESDLLTMLEDITKRIIEYERKARQELLNKKKIETEDLVYRALGILTHCKKLPAQEAVTLLTTLRLGVALEWIDIPLETINMLLYFSKKAHIQKIIDSQDIGGDTNMIDFIRAELVKRALNGTI